MATVIEGDFEWEDVKAEQNLRKHGVSFEEAATVFADPLALFFEDGAAAGRVVVVGESLRERVLVVVHVERGERDRIISARKARRPERQLYEAGE